VRHRLAAHHPFARPDGPDLAALTREEPVATFVDVPASETSALLPVISEMAGDDVLRAASDESLPRARRLNRHGLHSFRRHPPIGRCG
jgi:hypothetical protein